MSKKHTGTAYIVGGGIGGLTAAVALVRDAKWPAENIRIFEFRDVTGGCLDGAWDEKRNGFVARGERMLETPQYKCLWNILSEIPTLDGKQTAFEEYQEFNKVVKTNANARLWNEKHEIVDFHEFGLSSEDQHDLLRLIAIPEDYIPDKRIDEWFQPSFFKTNFWEMWRTYFAFQLWHSLIEMRRYILTIGHIIPVIANCNAITRTKLIGHPSITLPMQKWLQEQGVKIEFGVTIHDAEFETGADGTAISSLHGTAKGKPVDYDLEDGDIVIATIGSHIADSTHGDNKTVPEIIRDKRDGSWTLWENMSRKFPGGLGNPLKFNGNIDQSLWESFTLTLRKSTLTDRIEKFTGNTPGTGGQMTFRDSSWQLTPVVPYQPYFLNQPDDIKVMWGYGLIMDKPGDYVKKPMIECTGDEILTEMLGHFGYDDILEETLASTTVITSMMPYINSIFQTRAPGDRPPVRPAGAKNFALIGQFVEIPHGVVFTVEYSARGGMMAAYSLGNVDQPLPLYYNSFSRKGEANAILDTILANKELV